MPISIITLAGISSLLWSPWYQYSKGSLKYTSLREPVSLPEGRVYGSPNPSSSNFVMRVCRPFELRWISCSFSNLAHRRETAALAEPVVSKEAPLARPHVSERSVTLKSPPAVTA
ncbi:hypothetical protein [Streptomyces sp. KHY 26]|uniref:hypothetical protein n=1 Tax=Streptomyces sp. KHY 26 TaxID=3097359 RepID=UPI00376F176F